MKFISRLIRYLNVCQGYFYLKSLYEPLQYKSHNKKDVLAENWEDKGDMLSKTITITITNDTFEMLTEDMTWKKLFASEFLSALRKKWFNSHKFSASTSISYKKYKYLRSKHKNCFNFFNDLLNYGLAH